MKEELLKQLIPIAEKTKEGLLAAIEALQTQCPKLVYEILWWNGVYRFLWWLLGLAIIVVSIRYAKRFKQWLEGTNDDDAWAIGFIMYILASAFGLASFLLSFGWLKVLVAPRLFLLEYIGKILK